jgi:uncharacterized protein HemY
MVLARDRADCGSSAWRRRRLRLADRQILEALGDLGVGAFAKVMKLLVPCR